MGERSFVIQTYTSAEIRDRLRHHSKRLGCTATDIVREGLFNRLEQLDNQEATYIALQAIRAKAKKKSELASIATLPVHNGPEPVGLGLDFSTSKTRPITRPAPVEIPAKLLKSFVNYMKHVNEAGDSEIDRKIRMTDVLKDMQNRASAQEAEAAYVKFVATYEENALSKRPVIKSNQNPFASILADVAGYGPTPAAPPETPPPTNDADDSIESEESTPSTTSLGFAKALFQTRR